MCCHLAYNYLEVLTGFFSTGFQDSKQLAEWFAHVKRASRLSKAKAFIKKHSTNLFDFVQDSNNKVSAIERGSSVVWPTSELESKSLFEYSDMVNLKLPETPLSPLPSFSSTGKQTESEGLFESSLF